MTDEHWTPPTGLLEDIALVLRTTDDFGHAFWLDVTEHRVESLTFDPNEEVRELPDHAPDWQHQERARAQRILDDEDRYRRIPSTSTPGRLHDFIHSVEDAALRQQLWDAERGGRGAYRRVRGVLREQGLEQMWHDYEAEADRRLALDWLRSEGLLAGT